MAEAEDSLRVLVAQVAAAYFSNAHVPVGEITTVVETIAASLGAVGEGKVAAPDATAPSISARESAAGDDGGSKDGPAKPTAAQIRRSITPEALVSFENGKPYKTLRRHLAAQGLSPQQYRAKWGLPNDYPMVSPNYSAARSQMAKSAGLGQRGPKPAAAATPPAPVRRGRRRARGLTAAG